MKIRYSTYENPISIIFLIQTHKKLMLHIVNFLLLFKVEKYVRNPLLKFLMLAMKRKTYEYLTKK